MYYVRAYILTMLLTITYVYNKRFGNIIMINNIARDKRVIWLSVCVIGRRWLFVARSVGWFVQRCGRVSCCGRGVNVGGVRRVCVLVNSRRSRTISCGYCGLFIGRVQAGCPIGRNWSGGCSPVRRKRCFPVVRSGRYLINWSCGGMALLRHDSVEPVLSVSRVVHHAPGTVWLDYSVLSLDVVAVPLFGLALVVARVRVRYVVREIVLGRGGVVVGRLVVAVVSWPRCAILRVRPTRVHRHGTAQRRTDDG